MAKPGDSVWTSAQADKAARAVAGCTGGEFRTRLRDAREIAQSLPKPGEAVSQLDEDRAFDIYTMAGGLLKPSIVNPERAIDPSALFVKCPPDPVVGVELLTFLAADGPAHSKGPNNVFYWLGQAYRRGVGVAVDPAKARSHFLTARMLGITTLTAEDWGVSPSDDLPEVLARADNRRVLEQAASAGRLESQLLLGESLVRADKLRARALFETAARQGYPKAVRRLAALETQGLLGKPDFVRAATLLGSIAYSDDEDYRAMLDAARAYNGGDVPLADLDLSLADLGGSALIEPAATAKLDHIRGRVSVSGLLAPDGRVVFTEVRDPAMRGFTIARQTLKLFDPSRLRPVAPYMVNGKALFAWVRLPTVNWR